MYWFNSSKLADDFREGRVDERERFKYYLASLIAWSVVVQALIFSGTVLDVESLVSAGANLIVIVVGTVLCYRENRRGDDKDFIPRMICLGWPAGVLIALAVLGILLMEAFLNAFPVSGTCTTASDSGLLTSLAVMWGYFPGTFFFWPYLLVIHGGLTRIARPQEDMRTTESGEPVSRESGSSDAKDFKAGLTNAAWDTAKLPLGCLGGIALILLTVSVPLMMSSLGLSKRFGMLLVAPWTMTLVWLVMRLGKWEKSRSQRKSG